ncbi:MAG: SDR family oxidoreductase [Gammaproteobacteria bacterium]|nr:SDR family oxidoreductase [Gammaproteobacteria bacterium]
MSILLNKVAIVTGASSGIGYATSKLFAREGAKVVVAARRQPELNALVKEIVNEGGHAIAFAGDIQDENFAKSLVELASSQFLYLASDTSSFTTGAVFLVDGGVSVNRT